MGCRRRDLNPDMRIMMRVGRRSGVSPGRGRHQGSNAQVSAHKATVNAGVADDPSIRRVVAAHGLCLHVRILARRTEGSQEETKRKRRQDE
jgi:hypothetical protein